MFVLTDGVMVVMPGPAVLLVLSQGLRFGTAGTLWSVVGILAANALYFGVSGTGLGALLAASGGMFTAIRWAGAAYLLYMGAMALFRPPSPAGARETADPTGPAWRPLFLRGLLLQLSNPKALLFFVAILPQFIVRARPILPQILILGVTSIVIELVVLSAYGAAAARMARVAVQPRYAAATSRIGGALLVAAALGLLRFGG